MLPSVPVVLNNEACLVFGTSECVREFVLCTYIFKTTYEITAGGSAFNSTTLRIESLISREISTITDQSITIQLETSPKVVHFRGIYV